MSVRFFSLQPRKDGKGDQYQAVYYDGNCECVVIPDRDSATKMTEDGFWKVSLARTVYVAPKGFFRIVAADVLAKSRGFERVANFRWVYGNQWISTDHTNGITTRFVIKDYDQPRVAMPYLQTPHHVATWWVRATKVAWTGPNQRVVWVELLEDVTPKPEPVATVSIPTRGPSVSTSAKPKAMSVHVRRSQAAEKVDETLKRLGMSPVPQRPASKKRSAS